jgi:hypothetical protein
MRLLEGCRWKAGATLVVDVCRGARIEGGGGSGFSSSPRD